MRITFALIVVNTVMIQLIDPNFAMRVDDLLVFDKKEFVNSLFEIKD